jgi:hypothetical protein
MIRGLVGSDRILGRFRVRLLAACRKKEEEGAERHVTDHGGEQGVVAARLCVTPRSATGRR